MPDKQITHFAHGNAVRMDFPDHHEWFLPQLIRHLNYILAASDEAVCEIILKNNGDSILEMEILDDGISHAVRISYDDYTGRFDPFIVDIVKTLNTLLIHRFNGYGIVPLCVSSAVNESFIAPNLFFAFASRSEILSGIAGYTLLGASDNYLSIFPETATDIPLIPVRPALDALDLKYQSALYDGRHYLPVYPEEEAAQWLREELEKLLQIYPDNAIQLQIAPFDTTSGKMKVVMTAGPLQITEHLDRLNFYELGLMFNRLLEDNPRRYCLLTADEDNYVYAFCDSNEFGVLKKHGYVEGHYLDIFSR